MKYVGKRRFRNLRTPLFKKERSLRTFTAPNGLQSLAINCNLVYATPGLGFKVYDWKKSLESKPLDNIYIWLYIAYHSYVISVYICIIHPKNSSLRDPHDLEVFPHRYCRPEAGWWFFGPAPEKWMDPLGRWHCGPLMAPGPLTVFHSCKIQILSSCI